MTAVCPCCQQPITLEGLTGSLARWECYPCKITWIELVGETAQVQDLEQVLLAKLKRKDNPNDRITQ